MFVSMARLESQLSESRELTRILEVKLNAQAIDVDQQSTLLKQLKRKYQLVSKVGNSNSKVHQINFCLLFSHSDCVLYCIVQHC